MIWTLDTEEDAGPVLLGYYLAVVSKTADPNNGLNFMVVESTSPTLSYSMPS